MNRSSLVPHYGRKAKLALVAALATAALPALAAFDVSAVTTGITDAQTALTTIIGAFIVLAIAVMTGVMVWKFVRRK